MTIRAVVRADAAVFRAASLGLWLSCVSPFAGAATITTLFNTGVDAAGNALPDSTIPDPHYQLTSVPGNGTTHTRVIHVPGGFPANNYFDPSSTTYPDSRWIVAVNPSAQPDTDGFPGGNYTFRTTFDLTGFDPGSARIDGLWSTDDSGVDIRLNGTSVGTLAGSSLTLPASPGYTGFVGFVIASGFLAGLNTVEFIVYNTPQQGNNPIGLRVDMDGTASVVPLPAAAWLLASGFVGFVALGRRRRPA